MEITEAIHISKFKENDNMNVARIRNTEGSGNHFSSRKIV